MAVTVFCSDPPGLLNDITSSILNRSIETWLVDSEGDLTHSPTQWQNQAWFRPLVAQDRLAFYILGNRIQAMSTVTYAVYHGRLIEMLLSHFDGRFSNAVATAMPTGSDWVGPSP
jgi:hypothetical protein